MLSLVYIIFEIFVKISVVCSKNKVSSAGPVQGLFWYLRDQGLAPPYYKKVYSLKILKNFSPPNM